MKGAVPHRQQAPRDRATHVTPGNYALITGGSGFIGSNLADRLLREGERVVLYDNLSRPGVVQNYDWLKAEYGSQVSLIEADIRDDQTLAAAVEHASVVFHFAAQVAVTTSVTKPYDDFSINAEGTLKLLEILRSQSVPAPLIFTSTNKVYGSLSCVDFQIHNQRYEPVDAEIRSKGISEQQNLDFYSPYGCSKGTADQYVLDYARTYHLPALVFRMSCIYGPRQFGTEDQGWVAHFLIRALANETITLFGDGRQVRDLLFIDDLVQAFLLARHHCGRLRGQAYNIGGGPDNVISLLELMDVISLLDQSTPRVKCSSWRTGDQRYYVSDTSKFRKATGWEPKVSLRLGIPRLLAWLRQSAGTRSALALAEK